MFIRILRGILEIALFMSDSNEYYCTISRTDDRRREQKHFIICRYRHSEQRYRSDTSVRDELDSVNSDPQ